ncbi:MAG: hypothetical protein K0Q76_3435 [Panacagrimonas sp.]|nr:acyltransferase family protein [Panacagrimonas sp.]MCC2658327.1 hypothetical protein [Panacagrimonas sp.]
MSADSTYRPDVDGLRAVAIVTVVVFHAFPSALPGGYIGVDVFFVISGFLISSIIFSGLDRGTFSFRTFYARRIRRIFPALILVLAVTGLLGYGLLLPDELERLGEHLRYSAAFLENFKLASEAGYFDTRSDLKPLLHLWSLGVEEQFYLAYPVLMWLGWRLRVPRLAVIAVLGVCSFVAAQLAVRDDPTAAFFLPQHRFWELMVGCALAELARSAKASSSLRRVPGAALSTSGLLLIAIAAVVFDPESAFPGWPALLPVVGAALVIAAGADAGPNRVVLGNRAAVGIGLISYPLYLWHWPLLSLLRIVEGGEASAASRLAVVGLSLGLAWATYRGPERLVRRVRHWGVTAALCVLLASIVPPAKHAQDSGGMPDRTADLLRMEREASPPLRTRACVKNHPFVAGHFCLRAGSGVAGVALVGDSHAHHLYAGLAPAFESGPHTLVLLGRPGCLPFFDVIKRNAKGRDFGCERVMKPVLEHVLAAQEIRTVILSFRGAAAVTGSGFGDAEADKNTRLATRALPAAASNAEVFAFALRATLSRLQAAGKHVILSVDVPELGFDPKLCLAIRAPWMTRSIRKPDCAVPRADVEARNLQHWKIVRSVASEFADVELFDPTPLFCDAQRCVGLNDGRPLYRDENGHLSAAGSRRVATALLPVVMREPQQPDSAGR